MEPDPLNPASLSPGTRVGPWRVMDRRGWGAYGAVYRAFHVEEGSGPVALKLALHAGDERFAREVELLSRLRHPSIPRLVDHGHWRSSGLPYPYLAMQWVEGISLYEWARVRRPGSRQVLHVLASLARALEAVHAAGGVHRDVKGDNVLVSAADGQVFLTDFGSGHYVGAATLTSPPFPPGTLPYRSPEAWRSMRLPLDKAATPYAPGPADDVFALGITAYRLVTGEYPPPTVPTHEESEVWSLEGTGPRPPRGVNVRCCEELSGLVSRMLSVRPEARGSASELAEALERAARNAGPEADVPLFARGDFESVEERFLPRRTPLRVPRNHGWSRLAAAGLGGAVALSTVWMLSLRPGQQVHAPVLEEAKDGGTVAVGDAALTAPVPLTRAPSAWSTIAVDLPTTPLPSQIRPDATGRCPSRAQVALNGGCWVKLAVPLKDCDASVNYYVHNGACYGPVFRPGRPPTSGPAARSEDDAP
uniref:Serine/threonine protein kinase n=1 Tax=Pyxidicoccus fallax TaxID=394095 RepID=A0A346D796_9BACT|nr:serine/threonine protein kinase [Pyxidicoccus fallax]